MQIVRIGGGLPVFGSETVTVDNTAGGKSLSATKYIRSVGADSGGVMYAKSAFVTVEDQEIRVNFDPEVTVDATSNGHEFAAGSSFTIDGTGNIKNFRAIRTGASNGVIRVTYFG